MNYGDVVRVDFGTPIGSETGFVRPAVVVTSGNVGLAVGHQIVDVLAMIVGMP